MYQVRFGYGMKVELVCSLDDTTQGNAYELEGKQKAVLSLLTFCDGGGASSPTLSP
jgi:hypothetical protein